MLVRYEATVHGTERRQQSVGRDQMREEISWEWECVVLCMDEKSEGTWGSWDVRLHGDAA